MLEYYTPKRMNLYSDALVWDFENAAKADPRKCLEPHAYEVSALAYHGLAINNEDQPILVSGEPGAGKTETVKICLDHIASMQHGPEHKNNSNGPSKIVKKCWTPIHCSRLLVTPKPAATTTLVASENTSSCNSTQESIQGLEVHCSSLRSCWKQMRDVPFGEVPRCDARARGTYLPHLLPTLGGAGPHQGQATSSTNSWRRRTASRARSGKDSRK